LRAFWVAVSRTYSKGGRLSDRSSGAEEGWISRSMRPIYGELVTDLSYKGDGPSRSIGSWRLDPSLYGGKMVW